MISVDCEETTPTQTKTNKTDEQRGAPTNKENPLRHEYTDYIVCQRGEPETKIGSLETKNENRSSFIESSAGQTQTIKSIRLEN